MTASTATNGKASSAATQRILRVHFSLLSSLVKKLLIAQLKEGGIGSAEGHGLLKAEV